MIPLNYLEDYKISSNHRQDNYEELIDLEDLHLFKEIKQPIKKMRNHDHSGSKSK